MATPTIVAPTMIAVPQAGKVATASATAAVIATPVANPIAAPLVKAQASRPTRFQSTEATLSAAESMMWPSPLSQPPSPSWCPPFAELDALAPPQLPSLVSAQASCAPVNVTSPTTATTPAKRPSAMRPPMESDPAHHTARCVPGGDLAAPPEILRNYVSFGGAGRSG